MPSSSALPLVEELVPAPDPWDVARRLADLPYLLLLESGCEHTPLARHSFVAADPFAGINDRGGRHSGFYCRGHLRPLDDEVHAQYRYGSTSLDWLRTALELYRQPSVPELPPFQGGAAGLWGYGIGRQLERIPAFRLDEFDLSDLAVGFYDWVISFDHEHNRAWLVSSGFPGQDHDKRHDRAVGRINQVKSWLARPIPGRTSPWQEMYGVVEPALAYPLPNFPHVTSTFDRPAYEAAVRRVVEYIRAGDCFQVNLAQRLLAPLTISPLELYGRLRERNPAPFAGYFDLGDFAVARA